MDHIVLAAAEGETHSPVLPVWSEVILALIVFAILFVLLRKFVVPSFEKTFAERTQAIEGGLSAAETKQAEADAKLAELEKQLGDASLAPLFGETCGVVRISARRRALRRCTSS